MWIKVDDVLAGEEESADKFLFISVESMKIGVQSDMRKHKKYLQQTLVM
jgi:hypothetical protein